VDNARMNELIFIEAEVSLTVKDLENSIAH